MKNIHFKELALYITVMTIIAGVSNLVFSPESTWLLNIGYALFMGVILGSILYFLQNRKKS